MSVCAPGEAAAHLLNDAANVTAMVVAYIDSEDQVSYFSTGNIMICAGLAQMLQDLMSGKIRAMLDEGDRLQDLDEEEDPD